MHPAVLISWTVQNGHARTARNRSWQQSFPTNVSKCLRVGWSAPHGQENLRSPPAEFLIHCVMMQNAANCEGFSSQPYQRPWEQLCTVMIWGKAKANGRPWSHGRSPQGRNWPMCLNWIHWKKLKEYISYIYIILIYYIHFFPGLECSLHFNSTWPSERHVVKTLPYTAASLKLRSIVGEWLRNAKGFRSALNALKLRHLPICLTTAHMLEAPKVSVEV